MIINISDGYGENNILYLQTALGELLSRADCNVTSNFFGERAVLSINCPEQYADIIKAEVADKIAEIVAISYKYDYFKNNVKVEGLSESEKELLYASLIAADLPDDKKYCFERCALTSDFAIDGTFNFKLQALKRKWKEIASYIPCGFISSQLKEFIKYLLENKKKKSYIDDGKVYDCHFRRLKRSELLGGEGLKITREILLSNCGEIELIGKIPKDDEYYLKEFYGDRITFSAGYFG